MNTTNPAVRARNRYYIELGLATGLYLVLLAFSIRIIESGVQPPWLYIVAIVPMLAIAGILAAVVRFIAASDEFMRQTMMISLALAGGVTMMLVLTCGFLQNAGFPAPSPWLVWFVYGATWGISAMVVRRFYE